MARLILKSPYIKGGGKTKPSGFMNYIATRDGVELLPTSGYLEYMGTRPRAKKQGGHGLFSDVDNVNLAQAKSDIDNYTGNIWTHIISLKREDATRLGYDNADTWRNLLRSHRNEIAESMHIPPNNFRWYAAFHDEGTHPHVHMMAWSTDPKEGYLNQDGITHIRSKLTNDIFKMEMLHLYERKSQSRDELLLEAKQVMIQMGSAVTAEDVATPQMQMLMLQLSQELQNHKGKKSYGYLKKPAKNLVDEILAELSKTDEVRNCYAIWQDYQAQIEGYYHQKEYQRNPLHEEKAFQPLRNHIIKIVDGMEANTLDFRGTSATYAPYDEGSYDYNRTKEIIENDQYYLADRDKYFEKMEELADTGDPKAQFFMGQNYQNGSFVIPDGEKAMHYLKLAAEVGVAPAQYQLGKLLCSEGDKWNGMAWIKMSADQGNQYAQQYMTWVNQGHTPKVMQAVSLLLHQLTKVFDNSMPNRYPVAQRMDKKTFQKLMEKRQAMGIKGTPDFEAEQEHIRQLTMSGY